MSKFTFFFLVFLSFAINVNAQCEDRFNENQSDTFVLHQNIVYGRNITSIGDSIDLLLDIFEPYEPSLEPRPLIILAHGGSFVNGSKEVNEVRWLCEDLAKKGFVIASINNRLEPDFFSLVSREKMIKAVMRAAEDVKASIRYFYKSAEEDNPYNIDTDYIVAGGVSAGSIAALHAIYMDKFYQFPTHYQGWIYELNGDTLLQGNSGNPGYPTKVAGVINISGGLFSPTHMSDNIDIPLLSMHNTIDLTIQFGWGPPFYLPILPNLAGSQVLHNNFRNYGSYSDLYAVDTLNHVPHTRFDDGSKDIPVFNESIDRIVKLMRYIVPCTELPTSLNTNIIQPFTVFPNPATDILEIKGLENINDFSEVGGTLMNCGGFQTPWGTVLTAEETMYDDNHGINKDGTGITDTSDFIVKVFNGQTINQPIKRFENFDWMVEVDVKNAKAIRKNYNMGRYQHEGGTVLPDGKTVFLTDDTPPGYIFKFVANQSFDLSADILFIGGYHGVHNAKGEFALAKQNHDFTGYIPIDGRSDSGYVIVNHELMISDPILGDGGGMTVFKNIRIRIQETLLNI